MTALLIASGFGGILASVRYFQRLMLRVPDPVLFASLERHFRFLLISVIAATASMWFMNAFTQAPPWLPAAGACALVAPLFFVVFASLWFLILCREVASRLSDQALTAQKLWPAEPVERLA